LCVHDFDKWAEYRVKEVVRQIERSGNKKLKIRMRRYDMPKFHLRWAIK